MGRWLEKTDFRTDTLLLPRDSLCACIFSRFGPGIWHISTWLRYLAYSEYDRQITSCIECRTPHLGRLKGVQNEPLQLIILGLILWDSPRIFLADILLAVFYMKLGTSRGECTREVIKGCKRWWKWPRIAPSRQNRHHPVFLACQSLLAKLISHQLTDFPQEQTKLFLWQDMGRMISHNCAAIMNWGLSLL